MTIARFVAFASDEIHVMTVSTYLQFSRMEDLPTPVEQENCHAREIPRTVGFHV